MKLHANPVKNHDDALTYSVKINGQELDLFRTIGDYTADFYGSQAGEKSADVGEVRYFFGSFDIDEDAVIEITSSAKDLSNAEILPAKNTLQIVSRSRNQLVLKTSEPFMISVEPEGRIEPLVLLGKTPEAGQPDKNDPNVIWFGPGEHFPEKIVLKDNQTLYLESGSLVHAVLSASGDNIRICGRGVLSQEKFPRAFVYASMDFYHCSNLVIEGIIEQDPCFWNLVLRDCRNVTIDNIALCGGRMGNDDSVDICNCSNVLISNSFFRSQDDVIAVKGEPDRSEITNNTEIIAKTDPELVLDPAHMGPERVNENIEVRDCVFWVDFANAFRIGFECTAPAFRNFYFHDIEIIHLSKLYRHYTEFWSHNAFHIQASCGIPQENIRFERINIHSDGQGMLLLSICSEECLWWKKFGSVRNCLVKDITVDGDPENFEGGIYLLCPEKDAVIEDITLENITYFGKKLTAETAPVYLDGPVAPPVIR